MLNTGLWLKVNQRLAKPPSGVLPITVRVIGHWTRKKGSNILPMDISCGQLCIFPRDFVHNLMTKIGLADSS